MTNIFPPGIVRDIIYTMLSMAHSDMRKRKVTEVFSQNIHVKYCLDQGYLSDIGKPIKEDVMFVRITWGGAKLLKQLIK